MANEAIQQVDLKPIESKLATLRERATMIQVVDQESYSAACGIVLDGRKEIKAIGFVLDPGINSARDHLDTLRRQKQEFVDRVAPIVSIAEKKAEAWKAEERRKAQIEQDRINEERRIEAARAAEAERKEREKQAEIDRKAREKEIEAQRKAGDLNKKEAERQKKEAAEAAAREKERAAKDAAVQAANVQEVKVEASTPKVAGIRARVNWKFRIVDANKIPRAYLKADEVAIGQFVREAKKAGEVIPGIEAYSEDSI